MKVVVFDYGAGNLHSLVKAIARDGCAVQIERDPRLLLAGDILVLPGVGAFAPAAAALEPARAVIAEAVRNGHRCLGICLGMQLLFDASDEGCGAGLGIFPGRITPVSAMRIPHIGWNTFEDITDPLFERSQITTAYFANGFAARPVTTASVTAWSTHEHDRFPASVRVQRALGVQFHPEKSSAAGLRFLHAAMDDLAT